MAEFTYKLEKLKVRILEYVSFEDLYSFERVSKRWRDVVWKCGWPMRDTLSFEAITENSDYPNFKEFAKQDEEFLKWKARHEVNNKSVSFYSFECLFFMKISDQSFFVSNQCQTHRSDTLQMSTLER